MKYAIALLFCIIAHGAFSQTVVAGQTIPSDNFFVIRDYINTHLRRTTGMTHDEEDSKGDHLYDRWINYWQDHVNPDGSFPAPDHAYQEMLRYKQSHPADPRRSSGHPADWQQLAVSYPSGAPGVGRVDRVSFNSQNPNHLYVSTPSGSFWESLDMGATWRSRTDQLPVIGSSGIVVNPNDSNIIYMATGDGEANMDNPSIGVLKSYDAGTTWLPTGLSFTFTTGQKYISRLQMDPTNPSHLLVAASSGIYQTSDSGVVWTNRRNGNYRDIKYMPNNGAVCYATTSTAFYRSVDSGKTWTSVATGMPATGNRITIAVTPAAPAKVYLLSGGTNGLIGVYMSNDTGKTWTTQTNTPNILGYANDGSDNFSQSWYTLAFAVSPLDPNLLFAGGANVWTSSNAGVTWTCMTSGFQFAPYPVHVDIHELHFSPDGTGLYVGSDGGIYYHDLSSIAWNYISNGLQNTQVYRIAVSDADTSIVMYGAQDNDVVVYSAGSWDGINLNSDGFGCAIDPTNSNTLFGASQYGGINVSMDKGGSWASLTVGNQNADWDAPYRMNNLNHNELFAGMDYFYHTTDGGGSWTQLGALGSSSNYFKAFAFCAYNTQVIYGTYGTGLFKSIDGGATWSLLNNSVISGIVIKSVEVHPSDPDRVWITAGGYLPGRKVFYSDDGGQTFYNISGSLPNLSANTIIYQDNSTDVLYLGMDNGVYVYGDTLSDWVLYADNLPNSLVKELKIRYSSNELFAGTYGRGVWRSHLYQDAVTTGINGVTANLTVAIYPNPVTNELVINTKDAPKGGANIIITDAMGREIEELQTSEAKLTIPCGDFAAGLYIVSYEVNGIKTVKKFVKI